MSFIKNFPQTTFTLPSGTVINSINILKTFVLSQSTKENTQLLEKRSGVYTNKIENLNYEIYGDRPSLYWSLLYLNDIDSFDLCPVPQSNFESNLSIKYPGKVYYIKESFDTPEISKGDMVILNTVHDGVTTWRTAGIVKEYDSKFRRIILEREYENSGATQGFAGPAGFYDTGLEVRRKNLDSWVVLGASYEYPDGGLTVGRVENEADKILDLYQDGLDGVQISPYQVIEGSDFSSSYDFAPTGPTSGTVIYKLSSEETLSSPVSDLYFHTLSKEEMRKNTNANSINYFPMEQAFSLNSYVVELLNGDFRRGQEITVS